MGEGLRNVVGKHGLETYFGGLSRPGCSKTVSAVNVMDKAEGQRWQLKDSHGVVVGKRVCDG